MRKSFNNNEKPSRVFAIFTGLIGIACLASWYLDIPYIRGSDLTSLQMKANSAIGFALAGAAAILLESGRSKLLQSLGLICAGIMIFLGLTTLLEWFFNLNFGIDELILKDPLSIKEAPGRMVAASAFNFALMGIALLMTNLTTRRGGRPAEYVALFSLVVPLLVLTSYRHGEAPFMRVGRYPILIQMGPQTALAWITLALSVFSLRPNSGLAKKVFIPGRSSIWLRNGLLAALMIPISLAWILAKAHDESFYYQGFDDSVATVLFTFVLCYIVWRFGSESVQHEQNLRVRAEQERKRTSDILESITDGFFSLDRRWRYVYVNQTAERLVGRTREDLLGNSIWEMFPALVGSKWDMEYRRAVTGGVPVHFEEYYEPLKVWFETHAYPSEEGLTIYIRSINDRKRAELELEMKATQQANLAAFGKQAILNRDAQAIMTSAIRLLSSTLDVELVKILELCPDKKEMIMRAGVGWEGGTNHRVQSGELSQAGFTLMQNTPVIVEDLASETRFQGPTLLLEHGVVSGMSVVIPGAHGLYGILGVHSTIKKKFTEDDSNFLQGMANILGDAIERIRSSEALAESELRFRQIAENVREVFYVRELTTRTFIYVNPAYELVWGQPCSKLLKDSMAWTQAIVADDRSRINRKLLEQECGFFDEEYRISVPGRGIRWIHDRFFPVYDESGRAYRVVGTAKDITSAKELAESQAKAAASQAAVRARDEILAMVAHDIRNPLNAISLATTSLGRDELDTESRDRYASIIKRATKNAEHLVGDLLDVTRIESGKFQLNCKAVDVRPILRELCEAFRPAAMEKLIALKCLGPDEALMVAGDRERLIQALGNLLSNAIKFTPSGGLITVQVQSCQKGVDFSVKDTGMGIHSNDLPYVFDRFWCAQPMSRKGVGLGLTIVKGIAHSHGGNVWVESNFGAGSTFHFEIPVFPKEAGAS